MDINMPSKSSDVFEKAIQHNLDNGNLFAYGLSGIELSMLSETCARATETYAREILNWPNGRLAKPDIFTPIENDHGAFNSVSDCTEHFVQHLQELFESEPPKQLTTYPLAFAVVSQDKLPDHATLVLACKSHGRWHLQQTSISIDVELGQSVDSFRMGDITAEDILDKYASQKQSTLVRSDQSPDFQSHDSSQAPDTRVFAVFSTGLASALPLPAMIDPATDEVQPSEATLDLIADPTTSRFHMSRDRMLQLFPFICREDERRHWRSKGRQLHKQVLICCDNENPQEEGVVVIRMEWDMVSDRADEELMEVGTASKIHETRANVEDALRIAREIADDIDDPLRLSLL